MRAWLDRGNKIIEEFLSEGVFLGAFGVPLDGEGEGSGWIVEGFDDAVVSGGEDAVMCGIGDGLAVG